MWLAWDSKLQLLDSYTRNQPLIQTSQTIELSCENLPV